jgi:hypothetical protein
MTEAKGNKIAMENILLYVCDDKGDNQEGYETFTVFADAC